MRIMSNKPARYACAICIALPLLVCGGTASAQQNPAEYQNPVDGKTYVAPGGWKNYTPEQGLPPPSADKVKLAGVRLLTAQEVIASRTTAHELTDYIKTVSKVAASAFAPATKKAAVMVQIKSATGKTEVQMARQGEIGDDLLQSFYDQVQKLKPLRISEGDILYQIEYHIEP